uniref:Uncharacterized protein n=1 Tax=Anopheles dirus TaxID=7168 RepID=A0A182NW25_9DIPT
MQESRKTLQSARNATPRKQRRAPVLRMMQEGCCPGGHTMMERAEKAESRRQQWRPVILPTNFDFDPEHRDAV